MDKRLIRGMETKEKIINAALMIVSEEGTAGISAKKIADRASVSKSNIFHHFTSVDQLLESILEEICLEALKQLPIETCKDTKSFFEMLGDVTFKMSGEDLAIYRALYAYYYDALFSDKYNKEIIRMKLGMCEFLKNTLEQITGKTIPDSLAEIITIDIDGMGMHYMIEKDSDKYVELWKIKTELYVNMIESI